MSKKSIRYNFRKEVFVRDNFSCRICGKRDLVLKQNPQKYNFVSEILDCHHITNRNEIENGGYVKENGISLCKDVCHLKAEEYLQGSTLHEGFSPVELYSKIGSSYERAVKASQRLD